MTFDITLATLDDDAFDRLQRSNPEVFRACPTCHDRGSYHWRGAECECDCRRQKALAKHYLAAGIGARYHRLDWGDYEGGDERTLAITGDYVLNHEWNLIHGMGLLFTGPRGIGKTLLAVLVLKELIKLGHRAWCTTFSDTVNAFTKTWGDKDEKQWFERKFTHSEILLLDDLGREQRTKNDLPQSIFESIMRTRTQNNRPTLLTTNMSMRELGTGYGGAALSLLTEALVEVPMKGTDVRPRVRADKTGYVSGHEVGPIV